MADQNEISMQTRVLSCLEGGMERTVHQIASIIGETSRSVAQRLDELMKRGLVERSGIGPRKAGAKTGPAPKAWRMKAAAK